MDKNKDTVKEKGKVSMPTYFIDQWNDMMNAAQTIRNGTGRVIKAYTKSGVKRYVKSY